MTTGHFKYGLYLNLETRCVVLFHTKQKFDLEFAKDEK